MELSSAKDLTWFSDSISDADTKVEKLAFASVCTFFPGLLNKSLIDMVYFSILNLNISGCSIYLPLM